MKHALGTRLLHLLLATALIVQLADTQFMRVPRPGRTSTSLEASAFTVHEYVGLAAMGIVVAFWLWLMLRRVGTTPGQLFPWFSRARRRELRADLVHHLQLARRLGLPDPNGASALASALHGLGMLIALVMAATGTVGWLLWDQSAGMTGFAHTLFDIHGAVANLLWAYVIAHVGATLVHEFLGHRLLREMSPLPAS